MRLSSLARPYVACLIAVALTAPLHSSERGGADETFKPAIPDVQILDQHNRALRFHADLIKNKTVAINFIFTSCTTTCPLLTASMRALQRELADRVGRDVFLVSVSVDPTVDRPARLRALAEQFGAGDGWTFVTGSSADINRLLKALGSFAGDITAHTTTMLIGNDRTGRWVRTSGLAPASTNVKLIVDVASTGTSESSSHE